MQDYLNQLSTQFSAQIDAAHIINDEWVITTSAKNLLNLLTHLRDDPAHLFVQLIDITALDHLERSPRFDVVYQLLSLKHNRRLRIKLPIDEDNAVPSACDIYSAAGWYEREVWDMYGVLFADNPDLRRILTDYGFSGHPLRRDFPLTGYVELRYDEQQKRVVYEPVQLNQAYRDFDAQSPWEGPDYHIYNQVMRPGLLPGDEKASKAE